MGNPRRSNSSRRNKVLQWLRSQARPCWICGLPIDYDLPSGSPECFECDELLPISQGGSPYIRENVGASHRCCNNWRRIKSISNVQRIRETVYKRYGKPQSALDFVYKAKTIEQGYMIPYTGHEPIKNTTNW